MESTTRIQHRLDVFHQRSLRKILGITWKDKTTNEEVLQRTGQRRLQDIVVERRFRFAGPIICLPQERQAHCAMDWTPEEGAGEREEDQRRHGGQHSKRTYNYTWNQPV